MVNLKYTKINRIEKGSIKHVYDIEVDTVHAFTAKNPETGLESISHNSARMATKYWKDTTVLDFITVKRPIEYQGKSLEEIVKIREESSAAGKMPPAGFLWSSNNSLMVDKEFWELLDVKRIDPRFSDPIAKHARKVFKLLTEASYGDGTGEPGIINADNLVQKDDGFEMLFGGDYIGSARFQTREDTQVYLAKLARRVKKKKYHMITNPCGEICLNLNLGFCVLADVVPFHASTIDEAEEAFRVATRALIRVNTMDSIYKKEVIRTNRIGVGITGIHEFAWKFFGYGFRDLINEEKSKDFWLTMARFNAAVRDEAKKYSLQLGLNIPHTATTIKPAGCQALSNTIRTNLGDMTLAELFTKYFEVDLDSMVPGTWYEVDETLLVRDMNNEERPITKLYVNGVSDVYELEFEDGNKYKFTGNHLVLTSNRDWVRVDELADEDDVISFNKDEEQ